MTEDIKRLLSSNTKEDVLIGLELYKGQEITRELEILVRIAIHYRILSMFDLEEIVKYNFNAEKWTLNISDTNYITAFKIISWK